MPGEEKSDDPVVSILIVTWNSAGVVGECLKSIQERVAEGTCEVVLVDNAGSDETVRVVKEDFPWVRLIESGRNMGFARAMNLAASQARGKFLFLLNPDTVLENDVPSILADFLEADPEAGAASPNILEPGGGGALAAVQERPTLVSEFLRQFGLKRLFRPRKRGGLGPEPQKGGRLSGSAMMIPLRVWEAVGPLNEELPLYFEDLDISARIERSGRGLWRVPGAKVIHTGEQSAEVFPKRRMLLAMENGQAPWMYFNLYHGPKAASLFSLITFTGSLFRLTLARTVGWAALAMGSKAGAWRKRLVRNSAALLCWSWSSKKEFMIRVQVWFYGREDQGKGREALPGSGS